MPPKYLTSFITATANFSAAYNFQSIAIALIIMSVSVCTSTSSNCLIGIQASWVYGTATAISFIGAITGQLSMGYLGDVIGRSKALIVTMTIAGISALLSGVASYGNPTEIYTIIIIFRFFLGVGVGGVFPLAASKASEDSSHVGGPEVNAVAASWSYFWQLPAAVTPWIFAYILASKSNTSDPLSSEFMWRLILSVGSIPCALAVIALLIEEYMYVRTAKSTCTSNPTASLIAKTITTDNKHTDDSLNKPLKTLRPNISEALQEKKNIYSLLSSGGGWFCFDVISYGVSLLGGKILDAINNATNVSSMQNIQLICSEQAIALVVGIPMTLLSIYALRFLGLKYLQILSFFITICAFLVFAILYNFLMSSNQIQALFGVYCLVIVSLQTGVAITTYSLPAALFKRDVRSTLNGASSALGKCGAVVGAYAFGVIGEAVSYPAVMGISCGVASIGLLLTYFYVDDDIICTSTGIGFRLSKITIPRPSQSQSQSSYNPKEQSIDLSKWHSSLEVRESTF